MAVTQRDPEPMGVSSHGTAWPCSQRRLPPDAGTCPELAGLEHSTPNSSLHPRARAKPREANISLAGGFEVATWR